MNYHTSFARVCTITTLLSCLIVPRLVYAGWPMVKYKNGTVGILNDDGDVHVQNTNLFVYGKKVVHPEKCVPPGGRRQYFNGTEWMCVCEDGWSGLTCEIEEQMQTSTNNTPLTDSTFHSAISECLEEAPIDGLCVDYGSTSGYGVLPDWDVSQVVNMGGNKCTDADGDGNWDCILVGFVNTAFNGNVSRWDTSSVYYMHDMFRDAYAFNQPIGGWNLSNVNQIQNMFNGASAFNQPLHGWDVSNVYSMNGLFYGAASFNQPIESWNVSGVTEMEEMFEDAQSFNQPLGLWDVSSVTNMKDMFEGAISFNSPIDSASSSYYGWETSQVTSMEDMFKGALLFNQYIGALNVSRVQSMESMFEDAHTFDQPIHDWDVASVTSMEDMFQRAYSFNRPIGNWNTSSVTNMDQMFDDASTFEQDVSQWKGPAATSVATDRNMFYGATAFLAEFSCSVHGPASACLRKDTGPPKCVAPGGDKLQYDGTNWICVCVENCSGETCETCVTPPSPIAAGSGHACAILDDKSLKCWGTNWAGSLGLGDTNNRGDASGEMGDNLPAVDLGTGRTATAIAGGGSHTCAILDDKSLKCWGYNGRGELGLGDTNNRGDTSGEMGDNLPAVDLGTGRTATAIAGGGGHACAILDDKSLKCWGTNGRGELGLGDTNNRGDASGEMGDNLPAVDLGTGRSATAIASGGSHTCALLDDKSVKCWGYNWAGQLGLGDTNNRGDTSGEMGDNLPAVDLGTGRTATAIAIAEAGGSCALLDDKSVKCWGRNEQGALGLGDTNNRGDASGEMGDNLPAVDLGTGRSATAIATGAQHTCALLDDKSLKCWGRNDWGGGPLGLGDTKNRGDTSGEMGDNLPAVDLGTGRTVTAMAVGNYWNCARLDDKSVKCWGSNGSGQLGLGDKNARGDATGEMGDNLPAVDFGTGKR